MINGCSPAFGGGTPTLIRYLGNKKNEIADLIIGSLTKITLKVKLFLPFTKESNVISTMAFTEKSPNHAPAIFFLLRSNLSS